MFCLFNLHTTYTQAKTSPQKRTRATLRYTGSDATSPGGESLAPTEEFNLSDDSDVDTMRTPTKRILKRENTDHYSPGGDFKCLYQETDGRAVRVCTKTGSELDFDASVTHTHGFVEFTFDDGYVFRSEVPYLIHKRDFPERWTTSPQTMLKKPVAKTPTMKKTVAASTTQPKIYKSSEYDRLYASVYHKTRNALLKKGVPKGKASTTASAAARKSSAKLKQT